MSDFKVIQSTSDRSPTAIHQINLPLSRKSIIQSFVISRVLFSGTELSRRVSDEYSWINQVRIIRHNEQTQRTS